jgi:hypothetical protein
MQSKKANQQLKTIDSLDVDKKGNIVLTRERPKVRDIARRTPRLSTVKDGSRSGVASTANETRFLQRKIDNAIKDKVIQDTDNYVKRNDYRMIDKLPPIKRLKVLLGLEEKPKLSIADKKELLGESQYYARKDVQSRKPDSIYTKPYTSKERQVIDALSQLTTKKPRIKTLKGDDKINALFAASDRTLKNAKLSFDESDYVLPQMRTLRGEDKTNAMINATKNSLTKRSINKQRLPFPNPRPPFPFPFYEEKRFRSSSLENKQQAINDKVKRGLPLPDYMKEYLRFSRPARGSLNPMRRFRLKSRRAP